jgi:hypothetical protein|tara:strand:+ start:340 stop:459 length:120 start_codon:yes stop_codon:yes gene_type:complete
LELEPLDIQLEVVEEPQPQVLMVLLVEQETEVLEHLMIF